MNQAILRRGFLAASMSLAFAGSALAQASDDLVRAAEGKGVVLWYESTPSEQVAPMIEKFNERYPNIEVEHVRSTGGTNIAALVIQESQARAETASLVTGDLAIMGQLRDRGLLWEISEGAGINSELVNDGHYVDTAAAVYVIIWNTNNVSDDERPKAWEDFLDPKWEGRVGTWVRSLGFASLAATYGVEETKDLVRKFAGQSPMLYRSTFPLAQQVAAGEIDVAFGLYHTAQPPIQAGAPIQVAGIEPNPVTTIWSSVVSAGGNPEGGAVFLSWLVSTEGALAYEDATNRGSARVDGTKTQALVAGRTLSEWPAEEAAAYAALQAELNTILEAGGRAAD